MTVTETRSVTYCKDVEGLFRYFMKEHESEEYRLFIDSSKESLIICLLKNHLDDSEAREAPIILLNSPRCKENRESLEACLKLLKYKQPEWMIIGRPLKSNSPLVQFELSIEQCSMIISEFNLKLKL